MSHPDQETLLQYLQDTLSPAEREAVQTAIDHSPALQEQVASLRALQQALQHSVTSTAETALKPFFTDRVMRRLEDTLRVPKRISPEEELLGMLLRVFRPVLIVGVLLMMALMTYNITRSSTYEAEQSTTEAMLGLPPVTLAMAYDLDAYSPEP